MNRTHFTDKEIDTLRQAYGRIQTVNPLALNSFHAIFNGCSPLALEQIASAKIKFVSALAQNRITVQS